MIPLVAVPERVEKRKHHTEILNIENNLNFNTTLCNCNLLDLNKGDNNIRSIYCSFDIAHQILSFSFYTEFCNSAIFYISIRLRNSCERRSIL